MDCWYQTSSLVEGENNYIEKEGKEEHVVLLAFKGDEEKQDMWYLDSGASNHMCGKKNMFVD